MVTVVVVEMKKSSQFDVQYMDTDKQVSDVSAMKTDPTFSFYILEVVFNLASPHFFGTNTSVTVGTGQMWM